MASTEVLTIDRPDQLKALGHPLRLRVLEVLGEGREHLTNRELAARLGVDPGHLHFHVRMLLNAGLIELVGGGGRREKPYRAVAAHVTIAPELMASGAADDARAAMLDEVQHAYVAFAGEGRFRSSQLTMRVSPDQFQSEWQDLIDRLLAIEDPAKDTIVITTFWHPRGRGVGARLTAEAG